jgi:hypothetical protein
MKSKQEIKVILDVRAQILDETNVEFAKDWLSRTDAAEAVIAFDDKGDLVVVTTDGQTKAILALLYSVDTSACLVYLDEAHTRGTDLKLPPSYHAAVTLGPNLSKDTLVQGKSQKLPIPSVVGTFIDQHGEACMRMRKLGRNQSVEFLVSDEIAEKVRRLTGVQKTAELELIDIIRWTVTET